jgi:hypothetical protein
LPAWSIVMEPLRPGSVERREGDLLISNWLAATKFQRRLVYAPNYVDWPYRRQSFHRQLTERHP